MTKRKVTPLTIEFKRWALAWDGPVKHALCRNIDGAPYLVATHKAAKSDSSFLWFRDPLKRNRAPKPVRATVLVKVPR